MKKYPALWINKTFVTSHSFDRSLYPQYQLTKKNSDFFLINYLGNFYGPRNPRNFIKALIKIHNEDKDLLSNVVFRFVGKWIGNENWKSIIKCKYKFSLLYRRFKIFVTKINIVERKKGEKNKNKNYLQN